jgi:cell wall-active antibiotic response 4TMS protein YvqF
MNERPLVTGRLLWGLVVLTLGVLWTLDNLGQIDASQIVRWWPVVPIGWGLMLLSGAAGHRRTGAGWAWTIFGALAILRPLGIASLDLFDFWPVLLILVGGSLVYRSWTGRSWVHSATETAERLRASAFLGGSERKVVNQEFASGEINAVIAGVTVDFRGARLAGGRGVVDVFAMWGGIDLIVPEGWRVESDVTPVLGAFQDRTIPPGDSAAPTLKVRGSVVMGGVEVRNNERPTVRIRTKDGRREVRVGPGGVVIGAIGQTARPTRDDAPGDRAAERDDDTALRIRSRKHEVRIGPGGVVIEKVRRGTPSGPDDEPGPPSSERD